MDLRALIELDKFDIPEEFEFDSFVINSGNKMTVNSCGQADPRRQGAGRSGNWRRAGGRIVQRGREMYRHEFSAHGLRCAFGYGRQRCTG